MSTSDRRRLRQTFVAAWRFAFPLAALVALVLGYLGLRQHLAGQDEYSHRFWDIVYDDLQLFVMGSPPLDNGGDFPITLQIARFAAPAVAVYALFEAARVLFAAELVRAGARFSRRHQVICGDSAVARALAARLTQEGNRVVMVAGDGTAPVRRRLLALPGEPTDAEVLRAAGVTRARSLYVCSTDSARNLEIVLSAAAVAAPRRTNLDVHVQIDDPELCLALQARRLGLASSDRLQVNFFNPHELAARRLLAEQSPPAPPDRPVQIMVVGATWFGTSLIVELARHWRLHHQRYQPELIVVDDAAAAAVQRMCRLFPFLPEACRLTTFDRPVTTLLDGDLPCDPPDQAYLCCSDETVSLKLALTMDHFWRSGPRSVVVRLSRLGGLSHAFRATRVGPLLDPVSGKLHIFDALRAGSDPTLVQDSLVERLARAIHDRYLSARLTSGAEPDSTPATREWSRLSEEIKAANRAQAADVGQKLHEIGCALAPNPVWGTPALIDPDRLEHLAIKEHDRWCAHMRDQGWRYGPHRDDAAKRHPDLIGWTELPEASRDKDREAVRGLPQFLSDAGFQIVRLGPDEWPTRLSTHQ